MPAEPELYRERVVIAVSTIGGLPKPIADQLVRLHTSILADAQAKARHPKTAARLILAQNSG